MIWIVAGGKKRLFFGCWAAAKRCTESKSSNSKGRSRPGNDMFFVCFWWRLDCWQMSKSPEALVMANPGLHWVGGILLAKKYEDAWRASAPIPAVETHRKFELLSIQLVCRGFRDDFASCFRRISHFSFSSTPLQLLKQPMLLPNASVSTSDNHSSLERQRYTIPNEC